MRKTQLLSKQAGTLNERKTRFSVIDSKRPSTQHLRPNIDPIYQKAQNECGYPYEVLHVTQ